MLFKMQQNFYRAYVPKKNRLENKFDICGIVNFLAKLSVYTRVFRPHILQISFQNHEIKMQQK